MIDRLFVVAGLLTEPQGATAGLPNSRRPSVALLGGVRRPTPNAVRRPAPNVEK
jgi:hypothetical protein